MEPLGTMQLFPSVVQYWLLQQHLGQGTQPGQGKVSPCLLHRPVLLCFL